MYNKIIETFLDVCCLVAIVSAVVVVVSKRFSIFKNCVCMYESGINNIYNNIYHGGEGKYNINDIPKIMIDR